jgi:hypothetical protein
MNYEIVEVITDISGKFRARVIIDENTRETMFFKFDHHPSQEEVNSVVEAFLFNNQNMTL